MQHAAQVLQLHIVCKWDILNEAHRVLPSQGRVGLTYPELHSVVGQPRHLRLKLVRPLSLLACFLLSFVPRLPAATSVNT